LLDIADRLGGHDIDLFSSKDQIFRDLQLALSSSKATAVLVFEDVHWADEATLDLLRFVARRIEEWHVLLIATFRNDEVGDLHPLRQVLGDTVTATGVRRIAVNPLSIASVRTMAAGTGTDVSELYRQTGGNPFYITEVLATPGAALPSSVRDAVLARTSRLSAPARATLETASVIGFRSEPWLLASIAGADASGIEECVGSGVLNADANGTYSFRHDLARVAVLDTVARHRRTKLNRRILESLQSRSPTEIDAARLAHHADEAGDADAVLQFAPDAARRAARLSAHRDAIAQYERALKFSDRLDADERASLLDQYAHECVAVDRYDEAIEVSRDVLAHWQRTGDRFREADVLGFLSGCLVSTGRPVEAEPMCRRAIQLFEEFPRGAELAEAYARLARVHIVNRHCDESLRWSEKALDLSKQIADVRSRVLALNRLGSAMLLKGDDKGEKILREALALAFDARMPVEASGVYVGLIWNLLQRYEFDRAGPYLIESLAFAEEHQLGGFVAPTLGSYSLFLMYKGRWAEAEEPARNALNREHVSVLARILALTALGRLYSRRGDPRASKVLDEALAIAGPTEMVMYLPPVYAARAEAAWLSGDLDRVRTEARSSLQLTITHQHPWFAGELLLLLVLAGETIDVPEWIAPEFAMQIDGDWRGAAEAWQRRGCPYERAEALRGSDDVDALRTALGELERLGAEPAARRARRRLRELGVKRIPRGPHESTRSNTAGLTRREIEVAQLISDGLRNNEIAGRLFVSPKTVDHHVSSILSKLGVKARAHVAREVKRRGLLKNGEAVREK
jgi:DNA-binding CsgD family transcriptional regulator